MRNDEHNPLKILGGCTAVLIALCAFFALGHVIVSRFSVNAGTLLTAVISGLTGVVLFGFAIWIITQIRTFKFKYHPNLVLHWQSQMLDALAEIARGNFNVLPACGGGSSAADICSGGSLKQDC
jgi:hypothetical protein